MKSILLISLLLMSFSALAKPNYGNALVVDVVSVYDADTFRVNIKNWQSVIGENIPIRVNGVDAPEMRAKCESEKLAANKARLFTVDFLNSGTIELRNIKRGKYFRLLADVFVNGKSLTEALLKSGNARPYAGGKREGWCGKMSNKNNKLFNVIIVNNKTGRKRLMTKEPVTHKEGCTILSKLTKYAWRTEMLEKVV